MNQLGRGPDTDHMILVDERFVRSGEEGGSANLVRASIALDDQNVATLERAPAQLFLGDFEITSVLETDLVSADMGDCQISSRVRPWNTARMLLNSAANLAECFDREHRSVDSSEVAIDPRFHQADSDAKRSQPMLLEFSSLCPYGVEMTRHPPLRIDVRHIQFKRHQVRRMHPLTARPNAF